MAEIVWTEPALNDLDAIADYIALENPAAASELVRRVFERIEQRLLMRLREGEYGRVRRLGIEQCTDAQAQCGGDDFEFHRGSAFGFARMGWMIPAAWIGAT